MDYSTPHPLSRRLAALGALFTFAVTGAALSTGAFGDRRGEAPVETEVEAAAAEAVVNYGMLMAALERAGRVEAVEAAGPSNARRAGPSDAGYVVSSRSSAGATPAAPGGR